MSCKINKKNNSTMVKESLFGHLRKKNVNIQTTSGKIQCLFTYIGVR